MSEPSSTHPSSVAPGDSASSNGRKKSKPGKAERASRRSQINQEPGQSASGKKAALFAAGGAGEPHAQPGRFPVVFATGPGEPSRDTGFTMEACNLRDVCGSFSDRYKQSARFAEFKAHSGLSYSQFSEQLRSAFFLRLAQQVVHSHVNMGLPQGDFAPVASCDIRVPGAMSAVICQYGEFSVPELGTRYLYEDYENLVRKLVLLAQQQSKVGSDNEAILSRMWLPISESDNHFKSTVADGLSRLLELDGVSVSRTVLREAVLSGSVPEVWENLKSFLGDPPDPSDDDPNPVDERDRFDFIFRGVRDSAQFTVAWTTEAASDALEEIGLVWGDPSAGHLDWGFNAKSAFTSLADQWARRSFTFAQFFEMASGLSNRSAATGSLSQMVDVSTTDEVTVIKTHLSLSAPQFSLAACFPPECLFSEQLSRRVVVSTPVSVRQRATEFCQFDWR